MILENHRENGERSQLVSRSSDSNGTREMKEKSSEKKVEKKVDAIVDFCLLSKSFRNEPSAALIHFFFTLNFRTFIEALFLTTTEASDIGISPHS